MRMRASESPIQRQKKLPMRRVSFAEASDVFWLVLFPDEPNREAAIQGWALEMLHHPDPNQGPALRKIEQPNPDLADRISLTIEGRTLTLGVAVGSGETLTFSRRLTHTLRLIECLPKENPIHALLRGPQHRYCRDQVCNFLGSVARSHQFNDKPRTQKCAGQSPPDNLGTQPGESVRPPDQA